MTASKLVGVQNRWVMMVLMMVGHTEAANIELAWDSPPAQAAGYKLYYGQNSGDYHLVVDVGSQTSYTLSGLEDNQSYYFTVTAYDDMGNESPFADEVSAMFTAADSDPAKPIAPQAILPSAGVTRSNGHDTAVQHRAASKGLNTQSVVSSGVSRLTSEQIESGEIPGDPQWRRVEFRKTFVDPIVVARARGDQQAQPAVDIRGVNAAGFEVRLRSWGDVEALHSGETLGYLVIERGEYVLPDGILLEAGNVEVEGADSGNAVAFSQRFAATPVVITSVSNGLESEVVYNRQMMIGKQGFQLRIESTSEDQPADTQLSIDYIAWEPSWGAIDGLSFDIQSFRHLTDDASQTILFQQTFDETPVFLADFQEPGTGSAVGVYWGDKSPERVEVSIVPNGAEVTQMVRRDLLWGYIAVKETLLD